jgi:hypothetical protein
MRYLQSTPFSSPPANDAYKKNYPFAPTKFERELAEEKAQVADPRISCGKCHALFFNDGYTWCPSCDVADMAAKFAKNPGKYDLNAVQGVRELREQSQREAAAKTHPSGWKCDCGTWNEFAIMSGAFTEDCWKCGALKPATK